MTTPILNHPALHHPGATRAPESSRGPTSFDDAWRSVVDQRIAVRLDEADAERLVRQAGSDHGAAPLRARFGRVLIVIGSVIAGAAADSGAAGRTV